MVSRRLDQRKDRWRYEFCARKNYNKLIGKGDNRVHVTCQVNDVILLTLKNEFIIVSRGTLYI